MLEFLLSAGNTQCPPRKLRLYVCGCARRLWHLLVDERSRQALLAGERYAEGRVPEEEREAAFQDALQVSQGHQQGKVEWSAAAAAASVLIPYSQGVAGVPQHAREALAGGRRRLSRAKAARATAEAEQVIQLRLLRCIFGNPFCPMRCDPAWLNADVVRLAHGASDERLLPSGELDPQRLLVLADALEDAGCANTDVLGHLRGPGPRVRGCWVVDMLTGRE